MTRQTPEAIQFFAAAACDRRKPCARRRSSVRNSWDQQGLSSFSDNPALAESAGGENIRPQKTAKNFKKHQKPPPSLNCSC
jgi:hypothetical protein